MDHPPAVIVLTTWPAGSDPALMATTLVDERLAACVNVLPEMDSIYRWQGVIEHGRERQVVIKTTAPLVDALGARLRQLHPYDVPELLVVPVAGGSEAYLAWLADSTSPGPRADRRPEGESP